MQHGVLAAEIRNIPQTPPWKSAPLERTTTGSVHEESRLLPPFSGWQHQRGEKGKQRKGVSHLLSHWEPQSRLRFTRRKDPTACEAEVQHNKAGSYHRAQILLIKFVNAHTSIYSCSAPNVLWYKELGIEQWARWYGSWFCALANKHSPLPYFACFWVSFFFLTF